MIRRFLPIFLALAAMFFVTTADAEGKKGTKAKPAAAAPADEPAAHDDAAPATPAHDAEAAPAEHHGPITMKVGIELEKLTKFELGPGTYNAEFVLSFKCEHEPCKPE